MLNLKDCSEVTKLDSEVSLSRENFHFPRSGLSSQGLIVVQPRPEKAKVSNNRVVSAQNWPIQVVKAE